MFDDYISDLMSDLPVDCDSCHRADCICDDAYMQEHDDWAVLEEEVNNG